MGQTISLNDTPLGKELIGNVYETIRPVGLRTRPDGGRKLELLRECDEDLPERLRSRLELPNPVNPQVGTRVVKLPAGVRFEVLAIEKQQSFEGSDTYMHIDIMNNVWCDELLEYVAVHNTRPGFSEWRKDVSKHNAELVIRGDCKILAYEFFPWFSKGSSEHNAQVIKKIKPGMCDAF